MTKAIKQAHPVVETGTLPDGSTYRVEQTGYCHHLIIRTVGSVDVWGQIFGRQEDPKGQVAEVVAKMHANPEGFEMPWCPICGTGHHTFRDHPSN